MSVRHHGFSHSSLYKVTSKQAPRNLLIDFLGCLSSNITDVIITRIDRVGDQIVPVIVETIPAVDQFLGMAPEAYIKRPRLVTLKGTFGK